jgi:hypothetical protein
MGVGSAGNKPCCFFQYNGDIMQNAIANALRNDLFEGGVDRELTTTYDTLGFLTEAEKNNLIVELMLDVIKGEV